MLQKIKQRGITSLGSISGLASVLGSWQVCHNICLGLIVLLSLIGITITGMPLFFLTKIAVPIWIVAFLLLGVTLGLYYKKKCISRNLIILNSGLILAGIPFQQVQSYSSYFLSIGGIVAVIGLSLFIREKMQKKRSCHNEKR
ncbi:MAG: hypothetical protein Q8Q35_01925 [Nanoarchaeota archaeon]|nr:hypothetical protein [Nanoarchaeota archaeon]